jgi:alpha-L-fucosidase
MYRPGSRQNEYHVKTYGRSEKFVYKDFIPMFSGEIPEEAKYLLAGIGK